MKVVKTVNEIVLDGRRPNDTYTMCFFIEPKNLVINYETKVVSVLVSEFILTEEEKVVPLYLESGEPKLKEDGSHDFETKIVDVLNRIDYHKKMLRSFEEDVLESSMQYLVSEGLISDSDTILEKLKQTVINSIIPEMVSDEKLVFNDGDLELYELRQ